LVAFNCLMLAIINDLQIEFQLTLGYALIWFLKNQKSIY